MQLNDLKLISASNIIRLRQSAGLTQAELGARLNYSDKSISKWERGEAIPDAFVLTQLAAMFNVTVDYLLSSHDEWTGQAVEEEPQKAPAEEKAEAERTYSAEVLIVLVMVSIWTAAITAFAVLWIFGIFWWRIFAIALPVSLLVLLILISIFYPKRNLQYYISGFVASLFVTVYLVFKERNLWQVFLVVIPAVAIVFLACNLQKKSLKSQESKTEN